MATNHIGEVQTLFVPLDIVKASPGVAFDFGEYFIIVAVHFQLRKCYSAEHHGTAF